MIFSLLAGREAFYYANHPKRLLLKYKNIDEALDLGFIDVDDLPIKYDIANKESPEIIIGNVTGDHISGSYSHNIVKINPNNGGDKFVNFHEHLHWQRVGNPPSILEDYYNYKVDKVLYERNVLSKPCELVIHGLTVGARLGIVPFSRYPNNMEDILPELYILDGWTKALKYKTDKDLKNIWKILTGNFLY